MSLPDWMRLNRAQTHEAAQAAQKWHDAQAAVATANRQASEAAAAVAVKHKAANAAKAEAERLEQQAADFKQAGKRDAAKKTQQQAHRHALLCTHRVTLPCDGAGAADRCTWTVLHDCKLPLLQRPAMNLMPGSLCRKSFFLNCFSTAL